MDRLLSVAILEYSFNLYKIRKFEAIGLKQILVGKALRQRRTYLGFEVEQRCRGKKVREVRQGRTGL
jgi:hypothetical protein